MLPLSDYYVHLTIKNFDDMRDKNFINGWLNKYVKFWTFPQRLKIIIQSNSSIILR